MKAIKATEDSSESMVDEDGCNPNVKVLIEDIVKERIEIKIIEPPVP
jgi:hypothetical protein